jgi:thiamine kinase-like enzyme
MYLDLNNVLYYLYDNGYINESELFNEKFDVAKANSLNSVFLVRFFKTILVVKQAYNTGKAKEIALKKDAFFMDKLYGQKFYPKGHMYGALIDETKFIYTRKGVFSDTKIYDEVKNNSFNEWERLLDKIDESHQKINENEFANHLISGVPIEFDSLIFPTKIPIYVPQLSVEYSDIQKFWRKVSPEIIDLLNPSFKGNLSGEYVGSDKLKFNKEELIHGDLSIKNILYDDRDKKKGEEDFYLIDWEMCQYGDTMWDYATLYAEKVFYDKNKTFDFFSNIEKYIKGKFNDRFNTFKLYAILAQIKKLQQMLNLKSISFDDASSRLHLLNQEFKQLQNG